jgi:hypothetical protein
VNDETKNFESDEGRSVVFQLARRLNRESHDTVGSNCLKSENGLVVNEEEKFFSKKRLENLF